MKSKRVALLGVFGKQNLGNECTLQSQIKYLKNAPLDIRYCIICPEPEIVSCQYKAAAFPLSLADDDASFGSAESISTLKRIARIGRKIYRNHIADFKNSFRTLKNIEMLMIVGTGVLESPDVSNPRWPFTLLKWCLAAKMRNTRISFVSIGSGPVENYFSKVFMRIMFALSDYVSYRDRISKTYMRNIEIDTHRHPVFPDLAHDIYETQREQKGHALEYIGFGIMDYRGPRSSNLQSDSIYREYLNKNIVFIQWLIERGYRIKIIYGDARYDSDVRDDLRRLIVRRELPENSIDYSSASTVPQLVNELAELDIVISPRFHNLILSLNQLKPVISLSYHGKHSSLLEKFGLSRLTINLDDWVVDQLQNKFMEVESNFGSYRERILETTSRLKLLLDRQNGYLNALLCQASAAI